MENVIEAVIGDKNIVSVLQVFLIFRTGQFVRGKYDMGIILPGSFDSISPREF